MVPATFSNSSLWFLFYASRTLFTSTFSSSRALMVAIVLVSSSV